MISIVSNVHTYLVISFLLTGWVIFKFAYKKIDSKISADIRGIQDKIEGLEQKKNEAGKHLKQLQTDLAAANDDVAKALAEASQTAKEMTAKANQEISDLIKTKQLEYDQTIQKMKASLSIELQNKIIDAVIRELAERLRNSKTDREFQNASIENSINMLERLADQYISKND